MPYLSTTSQVPDSGTCSRQATNHGNSVPAIKKSLPISQMTDADHLDQAVAWAKSLTRLKARGPGDTENAMRRIEQEYGIAYSFLWSLRYRRERLKKISKSVFDRIGAAYRTECQRQLRKLHNEIAATEKIAGPDIAAVHAAKALVGKMDGEVP
jgi:hypothetical protein